jgi:hypothetical protein
MDPGDCGVCGRPKLSFTPLCVTERICRAAQEKKRDEIGSNMG